MGQTHAQEPLKRIYDEQDLVLFHRSIASQKLHHVMSLIADKVTATEVPENCLRVTIVTRDLGTREPDTKFECNKSHAYTGNIAELIKIFDVFDQLIDETPPLQGPRRFGNMACRDWHVKMRAQSSTLLRKLSTDEQYITELSYYLVNAFGSEVRLDYGSGHELSFIAFFGGLFDSGIIDETISGQEILVVFSKYYDLVRRLILDYSLEPAGSHGVWGLDDHFHFIYIIGAAQFNARHGDHHSRLAPPVLLILSSQTIVAHKLTNLYVNAIAFIFRLKLGPFHEHSPVLYDIHKTVSLWSKVQSGLFKMYDVEVFGKFPVVQHFWFGEKLYPWLEVASSRSLPVRATDMSEVNEEEEGYKDPRTHNNSQGIKTKNDNISMTGAPWARNNPTRTIPTRGTWGSRSSQRSHDK